MAHYNIIKRSSLKEGSNILAEHYQKKRIETEELLQRLSSGKIGQYFIESTKNVNPASLDSSWRVFDLPDSLSHFLLGGKNPQIHRISSNKKIANKNSFIISRLRHYLKEMAIVPYLDSKVGLSTEYLVYNQRGNFQTHVLLPFSLSKYVQNILDWAQTGNAHPRFSSVTFKNIPLPDVLIERSDYFANTIESAITSLTQSKEFYSSAMQDINDKLNLSTMVGKNKKWFTKASLECVETRMFDPKFHHPKFLEVEKSLKERFDTIELRRLAKIEYGYMPMQDYETNPNQGVPLIRVTNITDQLEIRTEDLKYIPSWVKVPKKKFVEKGDILMVQVGDTTGKVGYIYEDISNHLFPSFCLSVKVQTTQINSLFLAALLKSELIQFLFDKTVLINTVRPNTTKPRFAKLPIPIFPKEFQNSVAQKLEKSFNENKKAKQILESAKQEVETLIEQAAQTA